MSNTPHTPPNDFSEVDAYQDLVLRERNVALARVKELEAELDAHGKHCDLAIAPARAVDSRIAALEAENAELKAPYNKPYLIVGAEIKGPDAVVQRIAENERLRVKFDRLWANNCHNGGEGFDGAGHLRDFETLRAAMEGEGG